MVSRFRNGEEYREWAKGLDWYQTHNLSCGYRTPGTYNPAARDRVLGSYNFEGKSILDIGCNSGYYSFFVSSKGAARVVGVDIDSDRLDQAKTIKANEGFDNVDFCQVPVTNIRSLGQFDIVLCIAVLTEFERVAKALYEIKHIFSERAFLELAVRDKTDMASAVRELKDGRKIPIPSWHYLDLFFQDTHKVNDLGNGPRYRMVDVERVK